MSDKSKGDLKSKPVWTIVGGILMLMLGVGALLLDMNFRSENDESHLQTPDPQTQQQPKHEQSIFMDKLFLFSIFFIGFGVKGFVGGIGGKEDKVKNQEGQTDD